MNEYNENLYQFLTKAENFEPFFDLKEQYENVKRRLINEFWELVYDEIKLMPVNEHGWTYIVDAENSHNRKLRAKHPVIADKAGIAYEFLNGNVVLGAIFNRNKINVDSMSKIWRDATEYIKNLQGWEVGKGGWWYAIYKQNLLDMSQKASLMEILPEVRGTLAKDYALQINQAVKELGEFCIEQSNKH